MKTRKEEIKFNPMTAPEFMKQHTKPTPAVASTAMEGEARHTPTPLRVVDDNGDMKAESHEYGIVAAFEDENGVPFEEATRQHRAYIIRAVNAHEGLLVQLKQMHSHYQGSDMTLINGVLRHPYTCRTCEAIAKAEGAL